MIVAQFLLLTIIAAANFKQMAKKTGLAVTPRRTPITPNKLTLAKPKVPVKRGPLKKPVANNIPATKKPVVPTARKPAVNRTTVTKKPVVPKTNPIKKPLANASPAVKRNVPAKKTPVVKRPIPAKKIVESKKPAPMKKLVKIAPVKKQAPIKRATPTKITKGKMPQKQVGEVARTKSHLEAAMAYMKAQTPIENSGNRKIEDLLASPSEAQTAEPFDPHKFVQARSQKINEKNQKAQSSAAHGYSVPSWIIIAIIGVTIL